MALTSKGRLYREILTEVFRFRVTLLEGAEQVTAPLGLTSARWQVLSAVEDTPAPVSHVARGARAHPSDGAGNGGRHGA